MGAFYPRFSLSRALIRFRPRPKAPESTLAADPSPPNHKHQFFCPATNEALEPYSTSNFVPWPDIKSNLVKSLGAPENKINGSILRTCIYKEWTSLGLSFYDHVESSGGKLSLGELALVLKLLSLNLEKIQENRKVVMKLFEWFKPHLESQEVLHKSFAMVFSQFKDTWKVLADICEKESFLAADWVVAAAFNFDEVKTAWKIWNKDSNSFSDVSVEAYFDYCIRMAGKDKFSHRLINDLIKFCEKNTLNFSNESLISQCETLVSLLNKNPKEKYVWSVQKTSIDRNSCLSCGLKLNGVKITKEEIEKLKSHILKDALISFNVNIKSSEKEIKNFISFLENCSPYDVVVDGLNVLHHSQQKPFYEVIESFKSYNKKILLIGKKHVMKHQYFYYLKENCQIFLTENRSDDDLFIIYGTLHGGENTCFATADYLRGYVDLIQCPYMQKVFLKWKLSHQYQLIKRHKGSFLLPPKIHANLPQKTELPDFKSTVEEHCWHLPVHCKTTMHVHKKPSEKSYWLCLKAVQKQ